MIYSLKVSSCNTIDAKFFTDGYIEGPMYSENGKIKECSVCKKLSWLNDILNPIKLSHIEFKNYRKDHELIGFAWSPHCWEDECWSYIPFLEKAPWRNEAEEKYIRIRALWSWNACRRKNCQLNDGLLQAAATNCERLLDLFDVADDSEFIMRCEALRELGRFKECLTQLDRHLDNRYTETVRTIRALAEEGNPCVKRIKSDLDWISKLRLNRLKPRKNERTTREE
jgi:hypothetical protein